MLKNRRYHTNICRRFHEAPTTRWRYAYTITPIKRYAYAVTEITPIKRYAYAVTEMHTHTAILPDGYY